MSCLFSCVKKSKDTSHKSQSHDPTLVSSSNTATQPHVLTGDGREGETILQKMVGDQKVFEMRPRALEIIWSNDQRYWKLDDSDDGIAELLQVCWLEVTGSLELSKLESKTYGIKFKVSMKEGAFGWDGKPVRLTAKVGAKKAIWKTADLGGRTPNEEFYIPEDLRFEVKEEDLRGDEKLTFGLYEIWKQEWKGGLVIRGVEISPI